MAKYRLCSHDGFSLYGKLAGPNAFYVEYKESYWIFDWSAKTLVPLTQRLSRQILEFRNLEYIAVDIRHATALLSSHLPGAKLCKVE